MSVGDAVWFYQPYIENFLGGTQKYNKLPATIVEISLKKTPTKNIPTYRVLIDGDTKPTILFFGESMVKPRKTEPETFN